MRAWSRAAVLSLVFGALSISGPRLGLAQEPMPEVDNPHGADPHQWGNPHGGNPSAGNPHGGNPHAGGSPHGAGRPPAQARYRPPQNGAAPSPELAPGTIVFALRDAYGEPLPFRDFEILAVHSSVAQGESRERFYGKTDEDGVGLAESLPYGSGHSYTIRVTQDGATYDLGPLGLTDKGGVSGVLHAFEARTDITDLHISATVQVEMSFKEDVIAVVYRVHYVNQSPIAWVANDLVRLPTGFKAINVPDGMVPSFAETPEGVVMKGTVPPGELDTAFQFQIPLETDGEQSFDIGMPPNTAQSLVVTEASKSMGLAVDGFSASKRFRDPNGRSMLGSIREISQQNPDFVSNAKVTLSGMPKRGSGPWFAVFGTLSAVVLAGIYLYTRPKDGALSSDARADLVEAREALLQEFVALERARASGEVGPKAYARIRESMLDALARIMDRLERTQKPAKPPRAQLQDET